MKLSILCISFLSLAGSIVALPGDPKGAREDPDKEPITLQDQPSSSVTCGSGGASVSYTPTEIYQSVQYAVALKVAGQGRGRDNKYPEVFDNNDSKGVTLKFPKECPADDNRFEYPLQKDTVYNGGKNNRPKTQERVVYYQEEGEIDVEGHNKAYYCGVITHRGAEPGDLNSANGEVDTCQRVHRC